MSLLALSLSAVACQAQPSPAALPIRVGESVTAVFDPGQSDGGRSTKFEVVLGKGPVTIALESYDFDALLRMENEAGEVVAEDDDSGVESDARLVIPIETDESYVLIVSAKGGSGEFSLSIRAGELPAPSGAGLLDAAIAWRSTAAERALARGDRGGAAVHRLEEGLKRGARSQLVGAREAFESALALADELGERSIEARALKGLGAVHQILGDYPRSEECFQRALSLFRDLGDDREEIRTLTNIAIVFMSRGEFVGAKGAFEDALQRSREVGDRLAEEKALEGLGKACGALGDYPASRSCLLQQLALAHELGLGIGQAAALLGLGDLSKMIGDYADAQERFERALEVSIDYGGRTYEAESLGKLGQVHLHLGDYARARELYERQIAIARELGLRRELLIALGNLGNLHQSLGNHARAQEQYEESLRLSRELGARKSEATMSGNLGTVQAALGNYAAARDHHQRHLALSRELGSHRGEALALGNLGSVLSSIGDYEGAMELHERQLTLMHRLGDRQGQATAHRALGGVHADVGEFAEAREHIEQGLALSRALGDRRGEARALGHLGSVYYQLADNPKAREKYEEALALNRALGDRSGETVVLGNLGLVHLDSGDYAKARELFSRELAFSREVGRRQGEATALRRLAHISWALGDYRGARRSFEEAYELFREIGDRPGEANALGNLGAIHHEAGDYETSRECVEGYLALSRELGDRDAEANALANLANLLITLGDHGRAEELAHEAEALCEELAIEDIRVHVLGTLGRVHLARGDLIAARAALKEAEEVSDRLCVRGPAHEDGPGLRSRFSYIGEAIQDVTAATARKEGVSSAAMTAVREGFGDLSRWKSRSLLEGIAEHFAGGRSAEVIALRRERREVLAARDVALERVSKAVGEGRAAEEVDALRERAAVQLGEAERLAARLRDVSPREAALDLPLGITPDEVRRALLQEGDMLIEYAEGARRLNAYVVTKRGLGFVRLGKREKIEADVELFLSGIRDGEDLAGAQEVHAAGSALFKRLLEPALEKSDERVERLIVVPCASLASLPFEALVIEATSDEPRSCADLTFVLDRYEVTYGPSSPVLVELASIGPRRQRGRVLMLADPRYAGELAESDAGAFEGGQTDASDARGTRALPEPGALVRLPKTREEALAIAERLVAGEDEEAGLARLRDQRSGSLETARLVLHLGGEASRARLAGDLRGYDVVHLACHGFVDPEAPRRTGVALAFGELEDGWFTILDALELDLDADLVVLSACETARGEPKAGEGIESLARAFLYSGARGLVASLWQVEDRAAARTMEAFYDGWLHEGLAPARALREAKLALREDRLELGSARGIGGVTSASTAASTLEAGHPYFWAPFIHIGLSSDVAQSDRGDER